MLSCTEKAASSSFGKHPWRLLLWRQSYHPCLRSDFQICKLFWHLQLFSRSPIVRHNCFLCHCLWRDTALPWTDVGCTIVQYHSWDFWCPHFEILLLDLVDLLRQRILTYSHYYYYRPGIEILHAAGLRSLICYVLGIFFAPLKFAYLLRLDVLVLKLFSGDFLLYFVISIAVEVRLGHEFAFSHRRSSFSFSNSLKFFLSPFWNFSFFDLSDWWRIHVEALLGPLVE